MGKKLKVLMVFDCQMTRPPGHDYAEDLKEEDLPRVIDTISLVKKTPLMEISMK